MYQTKTTNIMRSLLHKVCKGKHGFDGTIKLLLFLCIFMFNSILLYSEIIPVGSFSYLTYNDALKNFDAEEGRTRYSQETNEYHLFFSNYMGALSYTFVFSEKDIETMKSIFDKYLQWNTLATRDGDVFEKEIYTTHNMGAYFRLADEWMFAGESNSIKYSFFSQNETRHQLVMSFSKLTSVDSEFMDATPQSMYFDKDLVEELSFAFSKTALEQAREIYNEKNKKYQ